MYWACVPLGILSVNWPVNSGFPCNVLGQDILSKLCISWQCSLNVLARKTGVCPQCTLLLESTGIRSVLKGCIMDKGLLGPGEGGSERGHCISFRVTGPGLAWDR